jgi:hypothetical protein
MHSSMPCPRYVVLVRRNTRHSDAIAYICFFIATSFAKTVTLFGAFHPLYLMHKQTPDHHGTNLFQIFWMAVFVASSLYSFTWDVLMDWGLGRPKHQFLNSRLMYPKRSYYYYIIALDLGRWKTSSALPAS